MKRSVWALGIAALAGVLFLGISLLEGITASNAAPSDSKELAAAARNPICLALDKTNREAYWSDALSTRLRGTAEHQVEHGRVDVLTADLAIEVDWFKKYHEGIGQALHYAMETGKQPAVALIVKPAEAPLDAQMASKLRLIERLTAQHGIHLFVLYEQSTCPAPQPARTAMRLK